MTKAELRKVYKEKRNNLSSKDIMIMNDMVLIKFQQIAFPADVNTLMSYRPVETLREVDTHTITDFLSFRIPGLTVAYPVADFATLTMQVIATDDSTEFDENKYGIIEPVNGEPMDPTLIDMVFVPLLAFDEKGFRVGYGKGFYDRFLAQCRKDCIRIGFSFFEPVASIGDINQFDVPLSYGVTPNAVYEF